MAAVDDDQPRKLNYPRKECVIVYVLCKVHRILWWWLVDYNRV